MPNTNSPTAFGTLRNFLLRAWKNLLESLSTSTLSVIVFSLLVPVATFVITGIFDAYQQGKASRSVINLAGASVFSWPVGIAVGVVVVAWLLLFLRSIANTLQADEVSHEQDVEQLKSELAAEHERKIDALKRANAQLSAENDKLKIKPYDEAHRKLVEQKIGSLVFTDQDLLRFLLQRGRTEQSLLQMHCQDHPGAFSHSLSVLEREGLIVRSDEPKAGRAGIDTYWAIAPTFQDVLRDLLFPAPSDHSSRFVI